MENLVLFSWMYMGGKKATLPCVVFQVNLPERYSYSRVKSDWHVDEQVVDVELQSDIVWILIDSLLGEPKKRKRTKNFMLSKCQLFVNKKIQTT